jgi:hypothetical protein
MQSCVAFLLPNTLVLILQFLRAVRKPNQVKKSDKSENHFVSQVFDSNRQQHFSVLQVDARTIEMSLRHNRQVGCSCLGGCARRWASCWFPITVRSSLALCRGCLPLCPPAWHCWACAWLLQRPGMRRVPNRSSPGGACRSPHLLPTTHRRCCCCQGAVQQQPWKGFAIFYGLAPGQLSPLELPSVALPLSYSR